MRTRRFLVGVLGAAALVSIGSADIGPVARSLGNHAAQTSRRAERGTSRLPPAEWSSQETAEGELIRFGTSESGRSLTALRRVGSDPERSVMVVGVIHGDERAGRKVTNALTDAVVPDDLELWIVPTINPDGEADQRHGNANKVDLNRNFPVNWESDTFYSSGKYYGGPSPVSEAETDAVMRLIDSAHPDIVVWYHSPWNRVDCDRKRVGPACTSFAKRVDMKVLFSRRPGTATDWILTTQNVDREMVSFVVEFGDKTPSTAVVDRHVAALLALDE